MEPVSKQRRRVPSCADALASPSTRRGSNTPSAPSQRAGGKVACSFRSTVSRCASADFATFPVFGAMAKVVEEINSVGGDGGDEGWSAALFQPWRRGGAAEILE